VRKRVSRQGANARRLVHEDDSWGLWPMRDGAGTEDHRPLFHGMASVHGADEGMGLAEETSSHTGSMGARREV
jgi:hypothetical protein